MFEIDPAHKVNCFDLPRLSQGQMEPSLADQECTGTDEVTSPAVGCRCGPTTLRFANDPNKPQQNATKCSCTTRESVRTPVDTPSCCSNATKEKSAAEIGGTDMHLVDSEATAVASRSSLDNTSSKGSGIPENAITNASLDFCGCGGNRWYCTCFNNPYSGYFCNCCPCAFNPQPTPGSAFTKELELCCSKLDIREQEGEIDSPLANEKQA